MKGRQPATRDDLGKFGGKLIGRMDRLGERLDAKSDGVEKRLDVKIDGVEKRLDAKIDGVETRLNARIDRLDVKIDGVEKRLDAKIDGVEKRLDLKIDGVDAKVVGVGAQVVKLQGEVRVLSQKVDVYLSRAMTSEEFHAAMDRYFAEQEAVHRSRELRADLWRDHERRISALEGKARAGA